MKRATFLLLLAAALLPACQRQVQPVPAPLPGAEASVVLRTNFAFNSYRLPPGAAAELDALAQAMTTDPRLQAAQFDINGHTDVVGRLGYNMGLSMLRAGAVVDALIARGVPAARLRPQGFGPLQLLDANDPRGGVNRRVEVVARPM
ncbi:OmpA family protein [Siccirubricoccus sp. KC 17139]|uniref:OmpA family protein n=1 Tax=Siccirubricoccus soli TaxID=2899147 RepID=A0ABT1D8J4_9PROT|nr:OmpA family protein [Siccirubricoccus soli]MCO6417580.1 OmpA family protein [Siccirubricoccus soli]MCP2683715.1 OmpA family protein [Siccirubricoccus soli]